MSVCRLPITEFLDRGAGHTLIDVRSPGEYGHAHLPGALSLPLFSDEERKEVGTAYKQVSREHAIKIGLDAFGPKMRAMVEQVERWQRQQKLPARSPLFIYCWRGGMRSGAVAWLLDLYGFPVQVLEGGYKAFRNYVLHSFTQAWPFSVIGGYTGSGKTEVLSQLRKMGESVIDLEALACHKGSAFGNINMPPQPSQEQFENLLALELRGIAVKRNIVISATEAPASNFAGGSDAPWSIGADTDGLRPETETVILPPVLHDIRIWVEDESQRIGQLHIPHTLWRTLQQSPVYFLEIPFEKRLAHILEEYGGFDRERLRNAISRISKRLGGLDTRMALQFVDEENIPACFSILLRYYDKQYGKGLHERKNAEELLRIFIFSDVLPENAEQLISRP